MTPSSLVGNWKREFKKWLGDQRLRSLAVNCTGKVCHQTPKALSGAPVILLVRLVYACAYAPLNCGRFRRLD